MLSHELFGDARLYVALLEFDRQLRDERREQGCDCGGVLHVASYERKPRGVPESKLPAGYGRRLSLCCGRDGCRRRATPASLRFLGRRVYLGAVVVLVCAMREGLSTRRVAQLRSLVGVSRRTLERWRRWWREVFATTPFWSAAKGRFDRPVEPSRLPASLLERFGGTPRERLMGVLRFLSPLSVSERDR